MATGNLRLDTSPLEAATRSWGKGTPVGMTTTPPSTTTKLPTTFAERMNFLRFQRAEAKYKQQRLDHAEALKKAERGEERAEERLGMTTRTFNNSLKTFKMTKNRYANELANRDTETGLLKQRLITARNVHHKNKILFEQTRTDQARQQIDRIHKPPSRALSEAISRQLLGASHLVDVSSNKTGWDVEDTETFLSVGGAEPKLKVENFEPRTMPYNAWFSGLSPDKKTTSATQLRIINEVSEFVSFRINLAVEMGRQPPTIGELVEEATATPGTNYEGPFDKRVISPYIWDKNTFAPFWGEHVSLYKPNVNEGAGKRAYTEGTAAQDIKLSKDDEDTLKARVEKYNWEELPDAEFEGFSVEK